MQTLSRIALTGEKLTPAGARVDRLGVYHDLISGVFSDTLERAYPLTRSLLGKLTEDGRESAWTSLVTEFVSRGTKSSPQLWQMPGELVEFARHGHFAARFETPWLDDLLRFEWMEIALYMMPDGEIPASTKLFGAERKPALEGVLVLNPDFEIIATEFPVFRSLAPEVLGEKGRYFLLGFRHRESGSVHFVELDATLVVVLELLGEEPASIAELRLKLPEIEFGPTLLGNLQRLAVEGMILGSM